MYERSCRHYGELTRNVHPNQHLQNAWNKYGEENFEINVIEYCNISDLNKREKYWITYYQSTNNIYGYNIRIDPFSNRGLKWSDEQRNKMNKKINEEGSYYKNHTIPRHVLEKAWNATRNKVWTEEERKRQSIILTGMKVKDTTKMKIAQTGENNGCAKLKENDVKEIIYLLNEGYNQEVLANIYNVSRSNISSIKNERSWNHINRDSIKFDELTIENAEKRIKMYD